MDESDNIMSFEAPVVVHIRCGGRGGLQDNFYRIGTRARVSLTIIDVEHIHTTFNNMDEVQWQPDGSGGFIKCK